MKKILIILLIAGAILLSGCIQPTGKATATGGQGSAVKIQVLENGVLVKSGGILTVGTDAKRKAFAGISGSSNNPYVSYTKTASRVAPAVGDIAYYYREKTLSANSKPVGSAKIEQVSPYGTSSAQIAITTINVPSEIIYNKVCSETDAGFDIKKAGKTTLATGFKAPEVYVDKCVTQGGIGMMTEYFCGAKTENPNGTIHGSVLEQRPTCKCANSSACK